MVEKENKHLLRSHCPKTSYCNIFVTVYPCMYMYVYFWCLYLFKICCAFVSHHLGANPLMMKNLLPYVHFISASKGSIHLPIVLEGKHNTMHFGFTTVKSLDTGAGVKSGSEPPQYPCAFTNLRSQRAFKKKESVRQKKIEVGMKG